jgi:hypothetical protein
MAFGRPKPTGCPRCAELLAGAPPRRWAHSWRTLDAQRVAEIQAHFASERHRSGGCGIVCTFGEW